MAYLFSNHSFSPPSSQNETASSNPEDYYESWKYKFIDYWSSHDTLFWLLSELYKLQVQNPATLKLEHFVNTRGCDLKKFSKEDFRKIIPEYGEMLYHQLQMKLKSVTDQVWRREMLAHQLYAAPRSSTSATHDRFNMAYYDQPLLPSSSEMPDMVPKHWPLDRRDYDCWAYKRLLEWTPRDTIDCLIHELFQMNINPSTVNLDRFRDVYGCDLAKMTMEEFKLLLPEYGELLFSQLQPKIKSNLKSEMPWRLSQQSQTFSNSNQPLSYAHRHNPSYAHPSCYRWELEHRFAGSPSDDSVLNLSRERTSPSTNVLSGESSSAHTRVQNLSIFGSPSTFQRGQSSIRKNDFSILNLTKSATTCSSTVIKLEKDLDMPGASDTKADVAEPVEEPVENLEASNSEDSCSEEPLTKTQNIQNDSEVSTADLVNSKGLGSYSENSAVDPGYNSDSNEEMAVDREEDEKKKVKRRPGRPRSLNKKDKAKGKVGRVWEFIRDLIMDPKYNPSVISWEDREKGLFRFRSGDQVAKLWGCKRGNPRMNFENFSRSIRQNYKKGYLLPVEKIRLVYQFGPRSTGWREGDPPTRPVSIPTSSKTPAPATTTTAASVTVAQ